MRLSAACAAPVESATITNLALFGAAMAMRSKIVAVSGIMYEAGRDGELPAGGGCQRREIPQSWGTNGVSFVVSAV